MILVWIIKQELKPDRTTCITHGIDIHISRGWRRSGPQTLFSEEVDDTRKINKPIFLGRSQRVIGHWPFSRTEQNFLRRSSSPRSSGDHLHAFFVWEQNHLHAWLISFWIRGSKLLGGNETNGLKTLGRLDAMNGLEQMWLTLFRPNTRPLSALPSPIWEERPKGKGGVAFCVLLPGGGGLVPPPATMGGGEGKSRKRRSSAASGA